MKTKVSTVIKEFITMNVEANLKAAIEDNECTQWYYDGKIDAYKTVLELLEDESFENN